MLTVPNLFTLLRLLCLPLFLWLLLGCGNRAGAAILLGALAATDWVDGYLARRLGQVSEFGKKFDPTVDRLVFIVALLAIIADLLLAGLQRLLVSPGLRAASATPRRLRLVSTKTPDAARAA